MDRLTGRSGQRSTVLSMLNERATAAIFSIRPDLGLKALLREFAKNLMSEESEVRILPTSCIYVRKPSM